MKYDSWQTEVIGVHKMFAQPQHREEQIIAITQILLCEGLNFVALPPEFKPHVDNVCQHRWEYSLSPASFKYCKYQEFFLCVLQLQFTQYVQTYILFSKWANFLAVIKRGYFMGLLVVQQKILKHLHRFWGEDIKYVFELTTKKCFLWNSKYLRDFCLCLRNE